MTKKKKFQIDIETVGLNGPGMLRDIDLREAIKFAEEIREQLIVESDRVRDMSAIPLEYFGTQIINHNTNYNASKVFANGDVFKCTMHHKTSDDFINGEVKHMLWGSQPGDEKFYNHNDGDYYWVQLVKDGEWKMGRINTTNGLGNYYFILVDFEVADYNKVHDYKHIEKPE